MPSPKFHSYRSMGTVVEIPVTLKEKMVFTVPDVGRLPAANCHGMTATSPEAVAEPPSTSVPRTMT